MAKERKQLDRRVLWLGAAIVLIGVFFAARSLLRQRLPVRAAQVTREELKKTIATNGRVEPVNHFEYHSPLPTIVKAVYVQAGDRVPAGKLLMQVDDAQARARLADAESGVRSAQASMEAATHNGTQAERQASAADLTRAQLDRDQAQHDLDALIKLNQTGAAAASEVSAARQRLASAQATLDAAQQSSTSRYSPAEVERARAALQDAESALAAAQKTEAATSYRAPIAGTVYQVDAAATEFVEEGKLLLQMADLKNVRVRAYFDEPQIGQLAVGQPILIKWDAKQGQEWHGHIARTPSTITIFGTRNVGEVLVAIDDPDGALLPDTNVTVTVTTSSEPNSLNIPREALHSENGKSFVYRIVNDERLERVPVTTGTITLSQVAILSGLQPGDWVATGTTNGQPLQLGVPIQVLRQ
jgi:HlyD family secretion protein